MISAISVKDRLRNNAVKHGKTFQEALTLYGLERTLYRLSLSDYADRFTLKGGIFLYALFDGEFARATRDIDLLAHNISNDRDKMKIVFEQVFTIPCDDALEYDLSTLEVINTTEFKEYHGVNISIIAYLDRTRIPVSIDIGFGDIVFPDRVKMEFPVLLDMDAPEIYAYSIYSVIAEKFEAIVSLGDANSRYKDFYDICILADQYQLDGRELQEAIRETFAHRNTGFDDIIAFAPEFPENIIHQKRWKAFLNKKRVLVTLEFEEVIKLVREILEPIAKSIVDEKDYTLQWNSKEKKWN